MPAWDGIDATLPPLLMIEPRDGDVVVVRASRAPDGRLQARAPRRFAVIEWGAFQLAADRMGSLAKDEAVFEARHCASERGRDAWDSTGKQLVRLPRMPLVYRGVGETFAVSVDVTDYSDARVPVQWKSSSHLSQDDAIGVIVGNGIPATIAKALIGKAPMPPACA